jgi:predicted transcriptional regulator
MPFPEMCPETDVPPPPESQPSTDYDVEGEALFAQGPDSAPRVLLPDASEDITVALRGAPTADSALSQEVPPGRDSLPPEAPEPRELPETPADVEPPTDTPRYNDDQHPDDEVAQTPEASGGGGGIVYGYIPPGSPAGPKVAEEFLQRGVTILALDIACKDEQERQRGGEYLTRLASAAAAAEAAKDPESDIAYRLDSIKASAEEGHDTNGILSRLRGSDMKVVLIGPTQDSYRSELLAEKTGELTDAVRNLAPNRELAHRVLEATEVAADILDYRERSLAAHVEQLTQEHPDAKVGVLTNGHYQLMEQHVDPSIPTEQFAYNKEGAELPATQSNMITLANELRFDQKVRSETLARTVLEETMAAIHRYVPTLYNSEHLRYAIARRTDEEVSQLLAELDQAKIESSSRWDFRRRTDHLIRALEGEGPLDTTKPPAYRELPPGSEALFMLHIHTPAAGRRIGQEIRRRNIRVVALEWSSVSEEDREQSGKSITFISSTWGRRWMDEHPQGPLSELAASYSRQRDEDSVCATLEELKESDAEVYLIDMPDDHPDMAADTEKSKRFSELHDTIYSQEPTARIAELTISYAEVSAYIMIARNAYMVERIGEVAEQHPGEVIAISTGLAHRPMLRAIDPKAGRHIIVNRDGVLFPEHAFFIHRLEEELSHGDGPTDETVAKAVLERHLWRATDLSLGAVTHLVEHTSHTRVQQMLDQLDELKATSSDADEYWNRAVFLLNEMTY